MKTISRPTGRWSIVDWTNEEGSRFAPAMVASGVWAGALDRDWAYQRTDINGKRFGDELARIGYKGDLPARKWPVHAYYEYHIEQGPILEKEGKRIGAPKGILCLHWYDIYLEGEANQVGPTPMEGRHDALCAAAEMILKVNQLPEAMGGNMVATVGEIQNYPNSRNIIPDKVHFTVDIRSWDDDHALNAWERLRNDFETIARQRGCPIRIEETWRVEHSPFDENLGAACPGNRRRSRVPGSLHGQRRRTRRQLYEPGGTHRHDLCAQHRRQKPCGGRKNDLGRL